MPYGHVRTRSFPAILGAAVLSFSGLGAAAALAQPGPDDRTLLTRYCGGCHNDRTLTAGVSLQGVDLDRVGAHAGEVELWEKVVRKLRTRAMPPAGRPRPTEAQYEGVAARLETAIDAAAAADPNPGRRPAVHRLNRAEYANAIRDLPRPRRRHPGAAPGRRLRLRLRQHRRRAVGVADADRALPVGGAQDQPARGGRPEPRPGDGDLHRRQVPEAGRAGQRRPAVRLAGRARGAAHLPLGRRVRRQDLPLARTYDGRCAASPTGTSSRCGSTAPSCRS